MVSVSRAPNGDLMWAKCMGPIRDINEFNRHEREEGQILLSTFEFFLFLLLVPCFKWPEEG